MSTSAHSLIKDFKKLIDLNALSHAYLFLSEKADDCRKLAIDIFYLLENKRPEENLIDGVVFEKKTDFAFGIETARSVSAFLWQTPLSSSRRSVLICDAPYLTPEAQNALLKIVEEPPRNAFIILSANQSESVIPPLSSRCQKIWVPNTSSGTLLGAAKRFQKSAIEFIAGGAALRKKIIKLVMDETEKDDAAVKNFIEALLFECVKDPVKNFSLMRRATYRFAKISQFNTNKKLQLEALL